MDAHRIRQALVARLRERFDRDWQIEPWEQWLDGLPDAEIPAEAGILDELWPDDRAPTAYRLTVVSHGSARLDARVRRILARLLARKLVTESGMHNLLGELQTSDDDAFSARIRELERLSGQTSLDGIHSLLALALRAIPGELWPAGPLHRGELRPDIGQASYPVLARTLAGWVDAPALRDRLLHAEERERAQTRPDMAGASLRPQVKRVAEELAATGGPEVTTFLARLDDELRRLDVVNALAKRKEQPTVPIRHCVWRASDGKAVRLHLAELADGRFGLLCKLKGRYRWMEGERDEILASVPEEWFAGAVSAALT
ncbi:MAG: hypothetical protein H6737_15390 [Alphaproteobacteria bacterium]|nr:hypothetical protein [Alphaproteobacteria bacterium]